MNAELVRAITAKRLIEFAYRSGGTRVAEPHDYGIQRGVECLLAFQISGDSLSGLAHGWKQFEVAFIRDLRVLERPFAGSRADDEQRHRPWDVLFARVR